MPRACAFLIALLCLALAARAQPTNPDFEQSAKAGDIPGWFVPSVCASEGWSASLVDDNPSQGDRCVRLERGESRAGNRQGGAATPFGNFMQSFTAEPYRGKRLAITIKARLGEHASGRAQPWVRVDRDGQQMGFFNNSADRPITQPEWQTARFVADIEPDAVSINIGLMVVGGDGPAFLDDLAIEVREKPVVAPDPPKELSERGLANLIALTRAVGYIRHYYPGDEAAAVEWETLIVGLIAPTEQAASTEELADVLRTSLTPIAPAARFQTKPFDAAFDGQSMIGAGDHPTHAIAWKHRGFSPDADKRASIYISQRIKTPTGDLAEDNLPEVGDHATRQCAIATGETLHMRIPIALYADDKGTFPRPTVSVVPPEPADMSAASRSVRLAGVILAWNVLQHHYPYFDVIKDDWSAALPEALRSAATDADGAAYLITLQRLTTHLHDGHGFVSWQNQPAAFTLPLILTFVDDQPVVLNAINDAVPKGIRPGDVVVSIGGTPVADLIADARALEPAATKGHFQSRAASRLTRRPNTDPVDVVLRAPDGAEKKASLKPVTPDRLPKERSGPIVSEPRPGIWYIDLDRATDKDLAAATPSLTKANGIVLDMRGYPNTFSMGVLGHWSDTALQCARWEIPMCWRPDQEGLTFDHSRWTLPPLKPRIRAKTAFIIDGRAISAAETFMGIVEHYKLAEIVGEPTAGTNGNVNSIALPGGYAIMFTGMKVLKHDGSQHHGIGILPTVPAHRTIAGIAAGKDEMLEKALDTVSTE